MTTPEQKWTPIKPPVFSFTVRGQGGISHSMDIPPEIPKALR